MAGARVPAVAVEHQYLLSGPIDGYTPVELGRMPTMRDPDHLVYYKPDGPGLLVGGYEPDTVAFGVDGEIPSPFRRRLFDAELRPLRPARRARRQAHAGARAGRHPHAGQRRRSRTRPTPTS